jgi:hypothetical protein
MSGLAAIASRRNGAWSFARSIAPARRFDGRAFTGLLCLKAAEMGNFLPGSSFSTKMKGDQSMATAMADLDRRPIRIDVPPEHAGVMAALRRAFQAAAEEPTDRDFADLLKKLN